MFFVFIDFQRKSPPYRDCRGSLLRPQASERSHQGMMARGHRARRPDARVAANFPRENWRGRATAAASEWMTQD
jgi:hypothetical protein